MEGYEFMKTVIGGMVLSLIIFPGDALGDCATVPGNLLTNCNFTNNILSWTQAVGSFSHNTTMGSKAIGSLQGVSSPAGGGTQQVLPTQCIPVSASTNYNYGIDHKLLPGGTPSTCLMQSFGFTGANCTGTSNPLPLIGFVPGASFAQTATAAATTLNTTISVQFLVFCSASVSSPSFTLLLDDAFFGPGLVPVELQHFTVD